MCRCERFNAYAGAKFSEEPTAADLMRSYPFLDAAQRGIREARKGGYGFINDTVTGQWWANDGSDAWRELDVARA